MDNGNEKEVLLRVWMMLAELIIEVDKEIEQQSVYSASETSGEIQILIHRR